MTDPVEDQTNNPIVCVATGKRGRAPGKLFSPLGVAIDEATHQIFVANRGNGRLEVFSETGEYLYQLGVGQLYTEIVYVLVTTVTMLASSR